MVLTVRPHKSESHRVSMNTVGNILDCESSTKAPTADLTTMKLLMISSLSTPRTKFMISDMEIFYLNRAKREATNAHASGVNARRINDTLQLA